jgi:anti-sigma-K factor RskA
MVCVNINEQERTKAVSCVENEDLFLLDAAGVLEVDEAAELRRHLSTGCPTCWGYRAAAEATLAELWLGLDHPSPSPALRQRLLERIRSAAPATRPPAPRRPREWERAVLSGAIAAVLAVAVTLLVVSRFAPLRRAPAGPDSRDVALALLQREVNSLHRQLDGMRFAQLTGAAQPEAIGRVFIDGRNGRWYFFTTGMKPPAAGKTYELWLISEAKKIPAGTFNVNDQGAATLLGTVPPLPGGAAVTLAVTDEPSGGTQAPTGKLQILGQVQ